MIERILVKYEDVIAEVMREGAYVSLIRYTKDGVDYEVVVENEDLEEVATIPLVRWEGIEDVM